MVNKEVLCPICEFWVKLGPELTTHMTIDHGWLLDSELEQRILRMIINSNAEIREVIPPKDDNSL